MPQRHQIALNNVSFIYDSSTKELISGLSVGLTNGWAGVVGPNGCGKTTLLKLATRFLKVLPNTQRNTETNEYSPRRPVQETAAYVLHRLDASNK